jgi:nitrite reductase (NO-forming)
MRRGMTVLVLSILAAAGLAAGVFAAGGGAGSANKTVAVTVVAKEFSFTLSKRSVPAGSTVVFTVVNRGKISHDFKIGAKKTAILSPGKSAKLTMKFTKKGRFAYLCTLPGHASAGMKGSFAIGVTPAKTTTPTSTVTSTTTPTTTTTPTGTVGNAQTTVTVNMVDYSFQLSQSTIPSGQVTFVINNKGNEVHNFAILGNRAGAQIAPGTSETWTVSLPPGTYNYQCDVPFHAANGMVGQFTVTP